MLSYNLSTVTKIRVFKKRVSWNWSWQPAKTSFFGLIKKPAGFVDSLSWEKEIFEDCPYNHYVEKAQHSDNMIVYEEPNLIMWFSDGSHQTFYFKTVDEVVSAAENIKNKSGCEWYEHK